MKRWLAWSGCVLGLSSWACGHATRNPKPLTSSSDGGCSNDCPSLGEEVGGAGGAPATSGGAFTAGGAQAPGGASTVGGNAGGPAASVPADCAPDERACFDRNIYQCDAEGTHLLLREVCDFYDHCEKPAGADTRCVGNLHPCDPGQQLCDQNLVKVCTEHRDLLDAGKNCGDLACYDGACAPKICEPGRKFCRDGDVHECLGTGATSEVAKPCGPGNSCSHGPDGLECVLLGCVPGKPACLGNQLGTCAPGGHSLSALSDDCATQGNVCDAGTSCVPLAVDDLSGTHTLTFANTVFNLFDVRSSRHLTQIELAFYPLAGDAALSWEIGRLENGSFQIVAVATSMAHAGDTSALTTELDYELEAGQRYRIGATVMAPAGAKVMYYVAEQPPQLSFGQVSRLAGSLQVYEMRLTTELP